MKGKTNNELIKFTGLMGLGGMVAKLFSIPHSIIFAKFLMPSGYGLLQIFKTIVSYFGYIQLGILQAMTRNIPKAYAEGDVSKVKKIKDLSFTWSLATTVVGLIVLWIVYYNIPELYNVLSFDNIILLTILIILSKINSFIKPLLKSEGEFIIIGKTTLYSSTFSPIVGMILVYFYNLNGAIIAIILDNLFLFFTSIYLYNKYIPKFYFQLELFIKQISKGILIFLYRFTETSFSGFVYVLIGVYYNSTKLGVFAFGLTSLLSVYKYSASIRMYYYRKIMLTEGSENKDNSFYKKVFKTPHTFNLFFNTVLLGFFALVYFTIITSFLSKYTESIPVMYLSIFGLTIYNARTFCAQFLDATNNLILLTKYIFLGVLVGLSMTYYFLLNDYSIYFIAISTGVGFTIMSTFIISTAFYQVNKSKIKTIFMLLSIYFIAALNTYVVYLFSKNNLIGFNDEVSVLNIIKIIIDLSFKVLVFVLLNYIVFGILFQKNQFRTEINKVIFLILNKIKLKIKK